jgi:hypothetical protein
MSHIVLAKAWNNGKFLPNGGGYGVWLTNYFKDEYLDIEWSSVVLELEGWPKPAELAINTDAFWSRGRELRSGIIGKWLIANGKGSWEAGKEPEIFLRPLGKNHFAASLSPVDGVQDSVDAILATAQTLKEE